MLGIAEAVAQMVGLILRLGQIGSALGYSFEMDFLPPFWCER